MTFPASNTPLAKLRNEVQDVLARSSSLKLPGQIGVTVFDGGMVVLSGHVTSAKERRLAESLICVTPGVRHVENQLTVSP